MQFSKQNSKLASAFAKQSLSSSQSAISAAKILLHTLQLTSATVVSSTTAVVSGSVEVAGTVVVSGRVV